MPDEPIRPPHDGDAEAAVLSAVMLLPALLDELRDIVTPEDFYVGSHRVIFDAMLVLDDAGTKIDTITLLAQLKAKPGSFVQSGGAPYLAQICDATPSVANVTEHARIVQQFSSLRRMQGALDVLSSVSRAPTTRGNVAGFLERCESEVCGVSAGAGGRDTGSSLHEVMVCAMAALDPAQPRAASGIATGLGQLDELTLGLVPGELWYVAARPGMGKTALALGIAARVAEQARHSVFFSMEMKRPELGERLISANSAVPYKAIQKRELSHDQWGDVATTVERLSHLPFVIDDGSTLTPSRLRSRVRRHASALRAKHPGQLGLVVVDYVQLMAWDKPSGSRNEDLEHISRSLKILAGEMGVTVLALAQLNRGQKDRADKRPGLLDLRGSGALEQDADKVLFVHRDESEGDERGEADLILGKSRNAALGRVTVRWEPWCVRFCESQQSFRRPGFDFGPVEYD